jgi:hypothetical protein
MQWMRRSSPLPADKAGESASVNAGKTRAEEERRPLEHLQREEMRIEYLAMASPEEFTDSRPLF